MIGKNDRFNKFIQSVLIRYKFNTIYFSIFPRFMWIGEAAKNVFIHYFLYSIEWGMCHNFLDKTLPPHPLWAIFESKKARWEQRKLILWSAY